MKTKLISLLVALFATTALWAYDFKYGDLYYNITSGSDKTVEVTCQELLSSKNYAGLTSVTIPTTVSYNGTTYSVTSIGECAFMWCTGLTSITISNSVKCIEVSAFSGCDGLISIVVESSNTTYDSRDNCNAIVETKSNALIAGCKTTTIPNSITSIGNSAFSGCSGLTSITIPNSVTSIGERAFYGCFSLTSITIPNSVTSIGDDAFYDCSGLTSITIPNSVTSIEESAFKGCRGLTSITIPNSITSIGYQAFSGCDGLTSIVVESSNTTYDSRDNCNAIVETKSNTLIAGCKTATIPNSITSIGDYAFYYSGLTSITIPNSVTSIGESAFYGTPWYDNLPDAEGVIYINRILYEYKDKGNRPDNISIVVKEGTLSISSNAFSGCTGLTSITIPNSVTSIEESAFYGCTGLTSITIPNSVMSIGDGAFSNCTGLTSVTIGNSVTSIGDFAFSICSGLTSVTIGNSVTSIGDCAFSSCSGLTSITIPNSVTSIGDRAFEDCTSLTSATIGNSVTSIGGWAFSSCSGLTSVTIGNSVTSIGYYPFSGCDGLTSIVVESSNTTYDSRDNCNAIVETKSNTLIAGCKTTTIPNSITSIGDYAFYGSGLTSITIPNSVTSIGDRAFYGCTGLTSITIPNSVTSIGNGAFSDTQWYESLPDGLVYINKVLYSYKGDMPKNTSVAVKDGTLSISPCAFMYCTGLTSITIPNSVTSIEYGTFWRCSSLTSITIPNSVTSIGDEAFYSCDSLTSVVIGNNDNLSIGFGAFIYCENIRSVTCYANVPPMIIIPDVHEGYDGVIFNSNMLHKMRLYVPAKAISQYKEAEEWKGFGQILPIGATTVDTGDEQPTVKPSFAEVTITWKIIPNAETYTIAITRGTETVCTLVFNADGQLTNIAFAAPSRYGTPRHAPAAVMTEQGYQFTVTGLESGSKYDYTLSVKDGNGKELQNYAGTFRTQGAGEGTAIDNPTAGGAANQPKVIRDGQMLIQRDGKTYTVTGMEVK